MLLVLDYSTIYQCEVGGCAQLARFLEQKHYNHGVDSILLCSYHASILHGRNEVSALLDIRNDGERQDDACQAPVR